MILKTLLKLNGIDTKKHCRRSFDYFDHAVTILVLADLVERVPVLIMTHTHTTIIAILIGLVFWALASGGGTDA